MSITLHPETEKLLEAELRKGGYASVDDLVRAGVAALEIHGDFEAGELDELLAEGEKDVAAGDLVDGEQAFAELDELSAKRRGQTK